MTDRIWLNVPYREKDAAKAAGAWWDPTARCWYAPREGMTTLDRWRPTPQATEATPAPQHELPSHPDGAMAEIIALAGLPNGESFSWVTLAPQQWKCHMCDSACRAGELQTATIRRRLLRRPLIICQPHEWRHHLEARHIPQGPKDQLLDLLSEHLSPGKAARWDPTRRRLVTVAGQTINWGDLR